jgi:hypothetical protein
LTVFWQEFPPDWQSEVAIFKSSLSSQNPGKDPVDLCVMRYIFIKDSAGAFVPQNILGKLSPFSIILNGSELRQN